MNEAEKVQSSRLFQLRMVEKQLEEVLKEKKQVEAHPRLSKDLHLAHNIEVWIESKKAEVRHFKQLCNLSDLGKTQKTIEITNCQGCVFNDDYYQCRIKEDVDVDDLCKTNKVSKNCPLLKSEIVVKLGKT